jgi:hypothetical protein
MSGDDLIEPLFDVAGRATWGRVRRGLEQRAREARRADQDLDIADLALARVLADHVDRLDEKLREPLVKPYDRVPLAGLAKQYADQLARVFRPREADHDPLADLIASVTADADRQP